MVEARMLNLHLLEPLFEVFVVHLIDHNHLVLAPISKGKKAGQKLSELSLLLPTSDNDADVIQLEIKN